MNNLLKFLAPQHGARAALLTGPPGCGKTYAAEQLAAAAEAELVVCLCHAWTDDQELFRGVDVVAAVAGDAENTAQQGVLWRVAEISQRQQVVCLLDEIDKAPERVEALLLDVLQSGRVPVAPGKQIQARLENIFWVLTSNESREHTDALLRRVRRVRMRPMRAEVIDSIVGSITQQPPNICVLARRACTAVAQHEGGIISAQEIARFVADLPLCDSCDDARESLAQWAARTARGDVFARGANISQLWGEFIRYRRELAGV